MGDTGADHRARGQGTIEDTYYRGSQMIVHRVRVLQGTLRENQEVAVYVESRRRQGLRAAPYGHPPAPRRAPEVLGTHVAQAGFLVAPDHLRFDFSHGASVKDSEVAEVEASSTSTCRPISWSRRPRWICRRRPPAAAPWPSSARSTAIASRVIRIGDFSTELCGGTHLEATGQIGLFKVVSEGAVASGVRRIEAVTGEAALAARGAEGGGALRESAGLLKIPPLELPQRLQKLLDEQKQLEKQLRDLEARVAKGRAQELCRVRQGGGRGVRTVRASRWPRRRGAPLGHGHAARAHELRRHRPQVFHGRQGQR